MKKIVIYGCGYSPIVHFIEYINSIKPEFEIVGFLDDDLYGIDDEFEGYPIIGNKDSVPDLVKKGYKFFNNVASNIENKIKVISLLNKNNAEFVSIKVPQYPQIDYKRLEIGDGSLISPNVTITSNVKIGKNVTIRSNSIIAHDNKIGDRCFIGPGAILLGHVEVGDNTYVGSGSVIRERVKIGKNCLVGMGAVVIRDVPDNTKVFGNPAKKLRV